MYSVYESTISEELVSYLSQYVDLLEDIRQFIKLHPNKEQDLLKKVMTYCERKMPVNQFSRFAIEQLFLGFDTAYRRLSFRVNQSYYLPKLKKPTPLQKRRPRTMGGNIHFASKADKSVMLEKIQRFLDDDMPTIKTRANMEEMLRRGKPNSDDEQSGVSEEGVSVRFSHKLTDFTRAGLIPDCKGEQDTSKIFEHISRYTNDDFTIAKTMAWMGEQNVLAPIRSWVIKQLTVNKDIEFTLFGGPSTAPMLWGYYSKSYNGEIYFVYREMHTNLALKNDVSSTNTFKFNIVESESLEMVTEETDDIRYFKDLSRQYVSEVGAEYELCAQEALHPTAIAEVVFKLANNGPEIVSAYIRTYHDSVVLQDGQPFVKASDPESEYQVLAIAREIVNEVDCISFLTTHWLKWLRLDKTFNTITDAFKAAVTQQSSEINGLVMTLKEIPVELCAHFVEVLLHATALEHPQTEVNAVYIKAACTVFPRTARYILANADFAKQLDAKSLRITIEFVSKFYINRIMDSTSESPDRDAFYEQNAFTRVSNLLLMRARDKTAIQVLSAKFSVVESANEDAIFDHFPRMRAGYIKPYTRVGLDQVKVVIQQAYEEAKLPKNPSCNWTSVKDHISEINLVDIPRMLVFKKANLSADDYKKTWQHLVLYCDEDAQKALFIAWNGAQGFSTYIVDILSTILSNFNKKLVPTNICSYADYQYSNGDIFFVQRLIVPYLELPDGPYHVVVTSPKTSSMKKSASAERLRNLQLSHMSIEFPGEEHKLLDQVGIHSLLSAQIIIRVPSSSKPDLEVVSFVVRSYDDKFRIEGSTKVKDLVARGLTKPRQYVKAKRNQVSLRHSAADRLLLINNLVSEIPLHKNRVKLIKQMLGPMIVKKLLKAISKDSNKRRFLRVIRSSSPFLTSKITSILLFDIINKTDSKMDKAHLVTKACLLFPELAYTFLIESQFIYFILHNGAENQGEEAQSLITKICAPQNRNPSYQSKLFNTCNALLVASKQPDEEEIIEIINRHFGLEEKASVSGKLNLP